MMLLKDKTIFVVEDDVRNRSVMTILMQSQGAKTHFDKWGSHTLEAIRQLGQVDLILMDLHLPHGVTGYDVYDQLQAAPDLAHIPVVVVSASDPNIEMNKARAKGFQGYISKPIDHRYFARIIQSILEGNPHWADDFVA
jgi:CheY-like chemotaxis protein